jgi:Uma2 family endonuclease
MSIAEVPMAQSVPPPAEIPDLPIWRLSVEQYHAMIQAGIVTTDDRIELLDGWLVPKMPKNPSHELCLGLLTDWLNSILPKGWHLRNQGPITMAPRSEPEPDLAVVRGSRRDFGDRHPAPDDVALVIEVADSSLDRDRGRKLRSYAASGIPEYWIVDLTAGAIVVCRSPNRSRTRATYEDQQALTRGQMLEAPKLLNIEAAITVSDVLP